MKNRSNKFAKVNLGRAEQNLLKMEKGSSKNAQESVKAHSQI